jgi:thiol-disulfide isomerase/thioredoxin
MRRICFLLASGTLILAFPGVAEGQGPPQKQTQTPVQNVDQTTTSRQSVQADNLAQSEQPMSLGDLARMVRAKKKSQPKAVKIFDDDNMPRTQHTGDKAPEFVPSASDEGSSSPSRGRPVLLDFWATWCGPCRHALPGLKQLQTVYGSDQLELISISEDSDESVWREFVDAHGMNWEQRLDTNHQMMRQYGASALPTYILIGSDGTILQQWVGDDPDGSLVDRLGPDLDRALGKKS